MSIYTDNGYENRMDYLKCMAADYGVDLETTLVIASAYGKSEDFDGLITALEDIADGMY